VRLRAEVYHLYYPVFLDVQAVVLSLKYHMGVYPFQPIYTFNYALYFVAGELSTGCFDYPIPYACFEKLDHYLFKIVGDGALFKLVAFLAAQYQVEYVVGAALAPGKIMVQAGLMKLKAFIAKMASAAVSFIYIGFQGFLRLHGFKLP